ncbi:hypothetical protein AQUCO_01700759v1 [Aquilegia coerulea]|uniref:Uncharacterized protein n=1 Tax=Aquilegia coerulea TaxID=218851 RepID=A0A2G5DPM5_AQUCA|nr:hypothetical protein AQUCO_01700759v1 [Aquilegia coerulea]
MISLECPRFSLVGFPFFHAAAIPLVFSLNPSQQFLLLFFKVFIPSRYFIFSFRKALGDLEERVGVH